MLDAKQLRVPMAAIQRLIVERFIISAIIIFGSASLALSFASFDPYWTVIQSICACSFATMWMTLPWVVGIPLLLAIAVINNQDWQVLLHLDRSVPPSIPTLLILSCLFVLTTVWRWRVISNKESASSGMFSCLIENMAGGYQRNVQARNNSFTFLTRLSGTVPANFNTWSPPAKVRILLTLTRSRMEWLHPIFMLTFYLSIAYVTMSSPKYDRGNAAVLGWIVVVTFQVLYVDRLSTLMLKQHSYIHELMLLPGLGNAHQILKLIRRAIFIPSILYFMLLMALLCGMAILLVPDYKLTVTAILSGGIYGFLLQLISFVYIFSKVRLQARILDYWRFRTFFYIFPVSVGYQMLFFLVSMPFRDRTLEAGLVVVAPAFIIMTTILILNAYGSYHMLKSFPHPLVER